ncbi:T9SS type B sorting domain-containing protein [Aureivirga marina]|uniref:T9SS type B sorting domain-containing protein n=1 Tax=Aureivirga marina TaxID=1182451 RepID=UPI0018CBCB64|nr:gliding motility-associated C-terminal domain-containing protein [Aureivirga marina]
MKNITFRKIKSRSILLLLFFCFYFYDGVYAQCFTEVTASPESPVAVQTDATFSLLDEQGGYDMSTMPTGWVATEGTPGMHTNSMCDPSYNGGDFYWFGDAVNTSDPRALTTTSYDFSGSGAMVTFYMKFAEGVLDSGVDCEFLDSGHGIFLQYSTDGGTSWNNIMEYDPSDMGVTGNEYYDWNKYVVALPAAAQTANTAIRWKQKAIDGVTNAFWGLDDIRFYQDVVWTIDGTIVAIDVNETPYSFAHTFTTAGTKNVEVTGIMYDETDSECNFTNSMQYTVVNPTFTTYVTSGGVTSIGETAMMSLAVENTSPVAIADIDVDLTFGDDLAPNFSGIPNVIIGNPAQVNVPEIAAGATFVLNIPVYLKEPSDANTNGDYYDDDSFDVDVVSTQTTYGIIQSITHDFAPNYTDIEFNASLFTDGNPTSDYQITFQIQNNGQLSATELYANLFVPSGFELDSFNAEAGTFYNGVWTIGSLNPGNDVELTLFLNRNSSGNYQFVGEAFMQEFDWDYANNAVSALLPPIVDLQGDISFLEPVPTATYYGEEMDLIVSITNQGNADSGIITVDELVPDGYDILAYNFLDGTYDSSTDKWDNFTLIAGENQIIELKLKIKTDTGSLDYSPNTFGGDDLGNNINFGSMPNISPTAASDLDMTFTVSNQNPEVGEHVEITVTLTNNGPSNSLASNIIVDFGKGNGLGFTPATTSLSPWPIATLNSGDSDSETFTFEVLGLPNGAAPIDYYDFWAEILSAPNPDLDSDFLNNPGSPPTSGTDPAANVEDDYISTTLVPVPVANMDITITDNKELYTAGDPNIYIVTVQNTGLSEAENVTITFNDFLEIINGPYTTELIYTSVGLHATDPGTIVPSFPGTIDDGFTITGLTFPAGEVLILEIEIDVPSNYTLVAGDTPNLNVDASVTTTTFEQDTNNNVAFDTNLPNPITDLEVWFDPPTDEFGGAPDYVQGEILIFEINIQNNGPSAATGVSVQDLLPSGYTVLPYTVGDPEFDPDYNYTSGVWSVGDLDDAAAETLNIRAIIDATGNYMNVATIFGNENDNVPQNNQAGQTIVEADIDVAITYPATFTPGSATPFQYTVVVTNNGPNDAEDVQIIAPLPINIDPADISWTATAGGNNGTGMFTDLIDLPSGDDVTYTISIAVPSDMTDNLIQYFEVSTATIDPTPVCSGAGDCSFTATPVLQTDPMIVAYTANPATPGYVGTPIEFTITVRNDGPTDAVGVVVEDILNNAAYEFVAYQADKGSFNYDPGVNKWFIGALAEGEEQTLTVEALILPGALNYGNTIQITSSPDNDLDSSALSNQASLSPVPNPDPIADLALFVEVDNPTPNVGDNVTFTLTLINEGPSDVGDLDVEAALNGMTSTSPDFPQWDINSLVAGGVVSTTIVATVLPDAPTYSFISQLEAMTTPIDDPDSSPNNHATLPDEDDSVELLLAPNQIIDLSVSALISDTTPDVGDVVVYTITVDNAGPSEATNVILSDLLPSGYEFGSATPSIEYNEDAGAWTIPTIAAGDSEDLIITMTVLDSGVYNLMAQIVAADQEDIDSTPNNFDPSEDDETTTHVEAVKRINLYLEATVSDATPNAGDEILISFSLKNEGPSNAHGVEVDIPLPSGLNYKYDNSAGAFDGLDTWTVGNLQKNTTVNMEMLVEVLPDAAYDFVAVAGIDGTPPPQVINPQAPDREAVIDLTVSQVANLVAQITDNQDTYTAGVPNTYVVQVENIGPSLVGEIDTDITIPPGTSIGNITILTNLAVPLTQIQAENLINNPASLPGVTFDTGEMIEIQFELIIPSDFTINNITAPELEVTVEATSDLPNPNPGAAIASDIDGANPISDLVIAKQIFDDAQGGTPTLITEAEAGDTVYFLIEVSNNGPSDADGIFVNELLPDGYTYVNHNIFFDPPTNYSPETGVWNFGALGNGDLKSLEIQAVVKPTGNFSNVTEILGLNQTDPDWGNNVVEAGLTVTPNVDLAVSLTVNNTAPFAGDELTINVEIVNNGLSTATGVQVLDIIRPGYTYINDTPSAGSWDNALQIWDVGNLPSGQSEVLTFNVLVNGDQGILDQYDICATIDSNEHDVNEQCIPLVPVQNATLKIEATDNKTKYTAGTGAAGSPTEDDNIYIITLENEGPSPALDTEILIEIPAGTEITDLTVVNPDTSVDMTGLGLPATPLTGPITLDAAAFGGTLDFDPGEKLVLQAKLAIESDFTIVNAASPNLEFEVTATSATLNLKPQHSTHVDTDHPYPVSDLEITKVSNNATPNVGDNVTFTIEVVNFGPSDADGVLVEELLPDGYTYVSDTGAGTYDPATGIWNLGYLAEGVTEGFDIVAQVNASGNYSNVTAIVALNQTDPDLTNNIVEDNTAPVAIVDLGIIMQVNNDEPNVGEEVVFTITVGNDGPSTATGLEIVDYLPNGYTFVSANPSMGVFIPDDNDGDNTDQDNYWLVDALPKDATMVLTLTAIVNDGNAAGTVISYENCAEIVNVNETDSDSTPGNGDPLEDDYICEDTLPTQVSDIKVHMEDGIVVYTAGTEIEYEIRVKNDGPSTATEVQIANDAPAESSISFWEVTSVTGTPTIPTTVGSGNINESIFDLKPGEEVVYTVLLFIESDFTTVRIANGDSPLLKNFTTITLIDAPGAPVEVDLDETNNTAEEEAYPNPISNLEIVKQVFDDPQAGTPNLITEAEVGSNVFFLIEVANPTPLDLTQFPDVLEGGPSDATGVLVNELLPTGFTYVGHITDGVNYDPATGLFNVGGLAVGEVKFLEIEATVNPEGNYSNITEITQLDQVDPLWENNTTEVSINAIPVVNLNVTKTVNNLTPFVGDNVVFTITAFNAGPSDATQVQLEDLLPTGFTIVSTAPSVGQFDPLTNVWLFDLLPANNTAVMTITAKVEKTTGTIDEYQNCVTITSDEDTNSPILEDCITLVPIQVADLSIFKEVDNEIPDVGTDVTFTIKLVNSGPSDATDVLVSDLLPIGFDYVSHTVTNGTYDNGTGDWSITTIPYVEANGPTIETLTIVATVTPDKTQAEYTNCTEVIASNEFDPDSDPNNGNQDPLEDDYACVEVYPTQVVDVSIQKVVDNLTPYVGMNVFFTLTVTNDGPSMATGLVVTDLLETGFDFVASNPSAGTYNEYTGSWDIGILAAGDSVTLQIEATVKPEGSYINCSAITGLNEKDIDSTINNNSDFEDDEACVVDIVPIPLVDLFVLKSVNNETPYVGDNVVFNIVVANEGPSEATAVIITDLLPTGYEFVSYDASVGVYDEVSGEWIVGIIPADASEGLSITAKVLPINDVIDEYVNCAAVTNVFEEDTDPANDESCVETYPIRTADISLNKTVDNFNPDANTEITFTVEVKNDGPSDANNLQIYDYIESGFMFVEASTTNGTYNESTGIWNINFIESGATALLFVKVIVQPTGNYENIAEVVFVDEFDFDSTPNNGDIFEDDYAKIVIEPIIKLEIPNGFSPNGDGINDVFEIKYLQVLYPNFSYEIYNRNGNKIYEYAHNGNPNQTPKWWDGYYDGDFSLSSSETAPAATYFYVINFNNNNRKPQTGWVYLNK